MKIIFFGSSNYVIPIVELLNKNFTLCLVVTTEKSPSDPLLKFCTEHKIPYLSTSSLDKTFNSQLSILNSPIGVVADFRLIIPKQILNLFPKGILNIHPSLLPKYRGPTPVQTTILNGDEETGISIIKLDEKIDHGKIVVQKKEKVLPNDTTESLYKRLFQKGSIILAEVLKDYFKGKIKLTAQNDKIATYTKKLTKQDGYIKKSKVKSQKSKVTIERMIRAYYPWPGVWTKFKIQSSKFKIVKFLPEQRIQVEGKKPASYKDFINGYREGRKILQLLGLYSSKVY